MQLLSEKWQYVQTIEAYIKEQRILLRIYSVHLNKTGSDFKKMFFEGSHFDDFAFSVFWER